MPNPGKPDAYEEVLALLAIHPIKTWACAKAGISRASFYAKLDRDPEYAELVERAMADGQAPLPPSAASHRSACWPGRTLRRFRCGATTR